MTTENTPKTSTTKAKEELKVFFRRGNATPFKRKSVGVKCYDFYSSDNSNPDGYDFIEDVKTVRYFKAADFAKICGNALFVMSLSDFDFFLIKNGQEIEVKINLLKRKTETEVRKFLSDLSQ